MKISIMQPYFFPYIGYFQLIKSSDVFVNLDHVNFMPRTYMVRNKLKNEVEINMPVIKGSQNKKCNEVSILIDDRYKKKFFKTLHNLYGKSKNYETIINLIKDEFIPNSSISEFNISIIKSICNYLDINTQIINSSSFELHGDLKKEKGLQYIVNELGGNIYINAIGGQSLYSKEDFKSKNIDLFFIKMNKSEILNPYLSILDVLFNYDKLLIKNELDNYELI